MIRKIIYWSNYTIVRWQLILTALAVWICYWYVKKHYGKQIDTNEWKVIKYFLEVFIWAIFILFASALAAVFATWFYFISKIRRKKIGIQTQFGDGNKAEAGFVPVTISITGFRNLWFVNLRARLVFSEMKLSDPILLDENIRRKKKFFSSGIKGTGKTMLHDRGIYDVEEVQLQFCDMFRLIALPYTIQLSQQLYTLPQEQKEITLLGNPNTTEEQTQRIEIPKRVEGEYINYKDFESGDDVRRIVWKIY